jgi:hypothetical protein
MNPSMSLLRITVGFALAALLLAGCGKEERTDKERPEIALVQTSPSLVSFEVCGSMSDQVLLTQAGNGITLTVRFTDDKELGSAKFDLHHNFDCHSHRNGTITWTVLDIVELSGTEQLVTRTFTPPDEVITGNYHLGIQCLDATGKEAEWVHIDVVVRDPSDIVPPEIAINSPAEGASHPLGEPLLIDLLVSDDQDMGGGEVEITLITPNGIDLSVARILPPVDSGAELPVSISYAIPGFVPAGEATLRISAKDHVNNQRIVTRSFALVP